MRSRLLAFSSPCWLTVVLVLTVRPTTLRIAVATGGEDARVVQAIARVFAREKSAVRLDVASVKEARGAASLLDRGDADLAIVRSDLWAPDMLSLAILRKSVLYAWSAGKPGRAGRLTQWKNAGGAKMAVLKGSPQDLALVASVIAAEGAPQDKVEIASADSIEAMAADRAADLFAIIGPLKDRSIAAGLKTFARLREMPNFLGVGSSDAITLRQPTLQPAEIPKGLVSANPDVPPEAVPTIAVNHFVVGRKALSEQDAAAFARELFSHRQAILLEAADSASIEKPDVEKDAAVPAHPGVAAYIDGTERTFLERYSDYFWGAILLISALSSFGAGLRAFLYHDEYEGVAKLRDRVMDLTAELREAPNTGDIAAIDVEIDRVVREVLNKYEEGVIDDGAISRLRSRYGPLSLRR